MIRMLAIRLAPLVGLIEGAKHGCFRLRCLLERSLLFRRDRIAAWRFRGRRFYVLFVWREAGFKGGELD